VFVVATVGNDDASKFQKTATIWVLSSGCYLIETASTISILCSIGSKLDHQMVSSISLIFSAREQNTKASVRLELNDV